MERTDDPSSAAVPSFEEKIPLSEKARTRTRPNSAAVRRQPGNDTFLLTLIPLVAGVLVIVCAAVFQLTKNTAETHEFVTSIVAAACGIGSIVAAWRPRWVLYGFIIACMVFPHEVEQTSISAGFMRLYPQDFVFGLTALLIIARMSIGKIRFYRFKFNRYLALHLCLGVYGALLGLFVTHNEFNDTLGDFRLSFFYLMNYFVILWLSPTRRDVDVLRNVMIAGSCLAILKGVSQFAMGDFVVRRFGDAAHIMTHFELTFSLFAVYYCLSYSLLNRKRFLLCSCLAAAGILVVLVGNFRTVWVCMFVGMLFLFTYMPGKQKMRLAIMAGVLALILASLLAVFWDTKIQQNHDTLGHDIAEKADIDKTLQDQNVQWRMASYANALGIWMDHPILGVGLGEQLEFFAIGSRGTPTMSEEGHRVHNSFIWLLMSLGVVGFGLLILIQYQFIGPVLRYLKTARNSPAKSQVLTCATFYFSIMTAACFDVYLESAMPITILSCTMALALMTIYYDVQPEDEDRKAAVPPAALEEIPVVAEPVPATAA